MEETRPVSDFGTREAYTETNDLFEELKRRRAETDALVKASQSILHLTRFEEAARRIFDLCKDLLGASSGYIALLNDRGDENEVLFLDAGGLPCTVDPDLPMPIRGLREVAYRTGEVAYDNDFMNSPWIEYMPAGHVVLSNVLFSPLIIEGKTVGLMGLANKPTGFTEEDAQMARAFGQIAAAALRNSRTMEEREQVQSRLQEGKELLERIFNSLNAAVFVVDPNTEKILDCNRSARQIYGYDSHSMIGEATSFLHADQKSWETFHRRMVGAMKSRGFFERVDCLMKKQNGEVFPADVGVVPLYDKDGPARTSIAWVMVVRDVTERKRLEERLRQSQKMEVIGNLAGGIAHDFNNILFPIIGYAEMLMDDLEGEEVPWSNANEIRKAALRAKEVVQRILTFGRKQRADLKPMKIGAIVSESVLLMRSTVPATIEIVTDIQDDPAVMASADQVRQIVMNLCTNAYQSMRTRGGTITVTLTVASPETTLSGEKESLTWLRLSVADTGEGMEPWVRQKIFDPYFTTRKVGEGTGMGLAVIDGIVKEHGGWVDVKSTLGKGSRFDVWFPLIETEKIPKTESAPPLQSRRGGRILLVDDDEKIVEMMRRMLTRAGYEVIAYKDGKSALAAMTEAPERFQCLVTDMTMPEMTGIELADRVLAIRPDIPVILCTGYSEIIDRDQAISLGIREFLIKPIERRVLISTLEKVIQ